MKQRFFERIGKWSTPPCVRKSLMSLKALTLLLVMVASVNLMAAEKTLTFALTSNPGSWPTANSTTLTDYTYTLDGVDYTFGLKNVKCNSGYLMLTSTAVLGLPAIEDYKLTKVVAKNSSGCSTSTKVGVSSSSSSASYITGGAIQTWGTTSSSYTYNLSGTEDNTVYYLYVTNKNAQVTEISLTYEGGDEPDPDEPSLSVSPKTIDFGIVYEKADVAAEQVTVTFSNLTSNDVEADITGSTFEIDKFGSFTSGDKITITPNTYGLGKFEETLILFSETDDLEERVTITMEVILAPVLETYNKVTAISDLAEGDIIVLASGTTAYGIDPGEGHAYIDAMKFTESQSASLTGNVLKAADAYELTLAKSGDNWTMTSVDGLVGTTAEKKMTFGSSDSKNVTTWSISIDGSANASITSTTSTYGTIQYNSSSPRFLNYTSSQTAIQIYKKELPKVYSAITLATCENGEVSVTGADDLTSVASGTEITLANTPADGYTLDEYDVYKTGDQTTKVTIENGKFKMPAYPVTVSATFKVAKVLNSVEITTPATKTEFWKGEEFSAEGLVLTAHFANGDEVVTPTSITGYDMATAGEQTVTVSFTEGATTKSDTYDIKVKSIANTKETAYTVAEAIALIDANPAGLATANVYVKGVVSTMISTYLPEGGGYLNYYVSEDGQTTSQEFEFYQNYKNSDLDKWTSLQDVQIGAQVIGYGTLTKYGETYEFNKNNYLVSYVAPENPKTTATITLSGYVTSLSTDDAADEVTISYNGDGELSATSSNTGFATAALVEGKLVVTPVAAGSATITVSAPETDAYTAASKSYTLTVTAGLTPATLPFTFDGGKSDINPANGIKADGLGSDYSSSPKLKFDGEGDYVIVKIASKAAQVSYKIKGAPGSGAWAGQFDVLESADGAAYTTVASHTALETNATTKTHDLLEDTRYIKFVFTTKTNGNVALGAINIVATKPKVDPTFSIANVDVTVDGNAPLAITTNSDGAVAYTIDPDNSGIEITDGTVYAHTAGTYTVTANKAETETYNAAQTTFTVTVSTIDYKTAEVTTFTAVNGGLLELGQFHSHQGGSSTPPAVNGGQIRLYQNGGYITISALPGLKIAKIDITSAMATSYNYKVDAAEDYTLVEAAALAANATANIAGLTADSVRIYCLGADKNSRFYVSYLKVYYTGGLETVSALAVDGAEKTEYEIGETVNHTGAVVTATFATAGAVDVTLNSTFTDPDMSTSGTKQVTANFAEQTATYDITVKAETPEITVDVTEVGFGTVLKDDVVDAKTVAVTLKAVANATVAVTGDEDAFTVTPETLTESGDITITPVTTAVGEFAATITISAEGAESKTIALSMNVEAPDNCDGTDDFETSENTSASSYAERTTDAGWSAVNTARTTIGDDVFFTINGKTSAVGVITSPVLEGGIASLKVRYANTMSESNGVSFRVDIKQGEDVVKTDTITKANADVVQSTVYTETISNINVAGTFQIVITNLSPSNSSSSNKDRVSIGRLCWTEYGDFVLENKVAGALATICLPKKIARVENATLFSISHGNTSMIEFVEETDLNNTVAGMPYLVEVTETGDVKFFTEGDAVETPVSASDANGFVGWLQEDPKLVPANGTAILISGGKLHIAGTDCWLTKNHAYIDAYSLPSEEPAVSAPGRRLVLTNDEAQVITGLNAIQVSGKTRKMMINNQMIIIREGKMYNATGALMK